jgi:uncharacterized protein YjiS (DUF1127 family)
MFHQIGEALRRVQERAQRRREFVALMALDDHLLRDIGVRRDDVRVRKSEYGF